MADKWRDIMKNDLSDELEDLLMSGQEDPNQRLAITSPLGI